MQAIPGFEGLYSITEDGRVFSHQRKRAFLKLCTDPDGYRYITLHKDGVQTTPRIHRLMALTYFGGQRLDHKDRNPLNNRRENLRPCTLSQNRANAKKNGNNTSGYRGVCWHKARNRWLVRIQINKRIVRLGSFKNLEDAAKAYDEAARRYFGEFAAVNFSHGGLDQINRESQFRGNVAPHGLAR